MQLINEANEQNQMKTLKSELKNLDDVKAPSQEELESELEKAYQHANANVTQMEAINFSGIGGRLLKLLKQGICKVVGPGSSSDDIINAVLDALVSLLPGGVLLKPLAKKLAKFIIDQGIGAFCTV